MTSAGCYKWALAASASLLALVTSAPLAVAQTVSFSPPGSNTVGLAWDGSHFWAADRGPESWIYSCEGCGVAATYTWTPRLRWTDGRLGTIAWGEGGLWVVDENRHMVIFADREASTFVLRTRVPIPTAALRDPPAITGLAWDGNWLWLVTGCGLCSGFYKIDPRDGAVLQEFFPRCEPRGLAFGAPHAVGHLWTIAYNGPSHRPDVSVRDPSAVPKSVLLSHRIRDFVSESSSVAFPISPVAITFALGRLWVVDRAGSGTIFPFSAEATIRPPGVPSGFPY